MSDFTNTNLEAALIDQNAAGAFHGLAYAFVAVLHEREWRLGVAVANERGWLPVGKKSFGGDMQEAKRWAHGLNEHIGMRGEQLHSLVGSTMFNAEYDPRRWLNA